jgi:hypothetical protein
MRTNNPNIFYFVREKDGLQVNPSELSSYDRSWLDTKDNRYLFNKENTVMRVDGGNLHTTVGNILLANWGAEDDFSKIEVSILTSYFGPEARTAFTKQKPAFWKKILTSRYQANTAVEREAIEQLFIDMNGPKEYSLEKTQFFASTKKKAEAAPVPPAPPEPVMVSIDTETTSIT